MHGDLSVPPSEPGPIWPPLFDATRYHDAVVFGSRNITWVSSVLEYGLPHALMARLTVFDEHCRVDVQKRPVKWDGSLAQLVAQIGLTALTTPTMVVPPLASLASMSNGDNNGEGITAEVPDIEGATVEEGTGSDDDDIDDDVPIAQSDLRGQEPQDVNPSSESSQGDSDSQPGSESTSETDGVRRLAHIRVFDLAYLHPSRAFRPYLPIDNQ